MNQSNQLLRSWIPVPADSDFPIQNLPFGIFRSENKRPRACSIIGDHIIDLSVLSDLDLLDIQGLQPEILEHPVLNPLIAQGKNISVSIRQRLTALFREDVTGEVRQKAGKALVPASGVEMLLPLHIGDYTDFYSSREHATNVGSMFRDPENALLPNWLHMPVGYHGRASSIVVSGTPVRRPMGQTLPPGQDVPVYGPSRLLDFELEMAFVIGKQSGLGQQITTDHAEDYIFGMVLFNDWSARDIQKWEYVPLGPFLGKNFASTISPWIVTLDALEPFRVKGPDQEPRVLPYLEYSGMKNYDLDLSVAIQTAGGTETTICRSNFKYMYWNMCQQLAHHTVNGCNVRVGDLCASGTISGPVPESYGSMLELSWRGSKPITLDDGSTRKFLHDGDTVILRGHGKRGELRVGFGEASGKILPV